jgi:hypothetical protein
MLFRHPGQPTPLRTRNYRLYFWGQMISVPGTVPVLVLGAWTGSVADAVDKRKLLVATQATQGVLALVLGILALTGVVQLWMVSRRSGLR